MCFRTYKLCQVKKSVHIWKLFQHLNFKRSLLIILIGIILLARFCALERTSCLLLIYKMNTVANKIHSINFFNYLNILHEIFVYIYIYKHILFSQWMFTITLENVFEANRGVYDVMNWLHKKLEETLFTPLLTPLLIMHWLLEVHISK